VKRVACYFLRLNERMRLMISPVIRIAAKRDPTSEERGSLIGARVLGDSGASEVSSSGEREAFPNDTHPLPRGLSYSFFHFSFNSFFL